MTTRHLLSVLVQDHPGILAKVAGLFSRRAFNIESLAVGHSEEPGLSRMTIVVNGDDEIVDQVSKQLDKLIDVVKIDLIPVSTAVQRELILVKVGCTQKNRSEIIQTAGIFRAKIIDVSQDTLTLELTGQGDKLEAFISMLASCDIRKIVRTGTIALERY